MCAISALLASACTISAAAEQLLLAGTPSLTMEGDLSALMVSGIDRWLDRETARMPAVRDERWAAGNVTVEGRRERLRRIIGAVDELRPGRCEFVSNAPGSDLLREAGLHRVRWPVFDDLTAEGLLLVPADAPVAAVVAIPDADTVPSVIEGFTSGPQLSFGAAQKLADAGCLVLVPVLVNRDDRWSGSERLGRFTNQPHREWLYRQAFEMGRTPIGYEVQKVQTGLDALRAYAPDLPLGIFGHGEGGLLALHTAALDTRIAAAVVSGYFGPRERLWEEPIYRNLFGFLREFGDAELAALIAPRRLLIEDCNVSVIAGPPDVKAGRAGAAPGKIAWPDKSAITGEIARANRLVALTTGAKPVEAFWPEYKLNVNVAGGAKPILEVPQYGDPGYPATRLAFLAALGAKPPSSRVPGTGEGFSTLPEGVQQQTVRDLEDHTQRLLRLSDSQRATKLWASLKKPAEFAAAQQELRRELWENVIGKLPTDYLPPNPRTRPLPPHAKWTGHEVVLDVLPEVFAWGWLLVPKDLKPGERRPVVVCQHGLEGLPEDVVTEDPQSRAFGFYKGFASQLAARGFIVYAPHNPYRGKDAFRMLQRKANPLGLSLFSFILAQHDVTTRWLATLPFVDPARIGFYGLSYGGKTAMRAPALLDRYALSICSGDFNEWIGKVVSTAWQSNYPFTGEWEMPEWNLGHVAGYAEMAMLIAPRPFMVERGHDDGVALDQWVGYEWGKVRRGYDKLGIGERAEIEWFDGPHTIHGVATFQFLHRHLRWPER